MGYQLKFDRSQQDHVIIDEFVLSSCPGLELSSFKPLDATYGFSRSSQSRFKMYSPAL